MKPIIICFCVMISPLDLRELDALSAAEGKPDVSRTTQTNKAATENFSEAASEPILSCRHGVTCRETAPRIITRALAALDAHGLTRNKMY